jgi:hypothetical protein
MTQPQTKSSDESRRGHEFIEGTLSTPSLQYDLMEEIKQLHREEWVGDLEVRSGGFSFFVL